MKNRYEFKKYLNISILLIIIFSIIFLVIEKLEYNRYTYNVNIKINNVINILRDKYPDVTDNDIISILNSDEGVKTDFLKKYSINLKNDSIIKNNMKYSNKFLIINICYLILSMSTVILLFLQYNRKKNKDIESITKCIEEINKRNYKLDLDEMSEDELSILKNEIFKTTIMLKEQAEIAKTDKIKLKDSLSDISHQLKTPITSIIIMLDNIIDNPIMEKEIRDDFIKEIKIEIANINFLVQSILKLSKIDSNTVEYINTNIKVSDLINKSIARLLPLCDLRNIKINVNIQNDDIIICDEMWHIEAISNVIKNCIEHSMENSKINIIIDSNNAYSLIKIIDYGTGISKSDINHIFDRFYKGKNSDTNSIGIGLALSKAIINKSNGIISVESEENKGTCFTIKYFKN